MATIPPGRLNDVTNAADHITLVGDNFEILSEELFKVTPQGFGANVHNLLSGRMIEEYAGQTAQPRARWPA